MEPGDLVADRFRLECLLGRGGMGSVWRAHHLSLDTTVAIKFIEGDASVMPELRARFEREARAAAKLKSPNAVQVLDHGEWQGTPYLVMELLEGEDLAHRLARVGRLPPARLVAIVREVGRALDRAHGLGIVHRDLKPENVFLVKDGDGEIAKVVDFGIAKVQGSSLGDSKTRTGALLGTPYYMSPEQAEGTRDVDGRSDLWSLGVIAFECVTGRLPFESEALGDLLMKIMVKPIPIPSEVAPDVPRAFDAFWLRASDRDPAKRFQTAAELAQWLGVALGVRGTSPSLADAGAAIDDVDVEAPTSLRFTPPGARYDEAVVSMRTMLASEQGTLGGQTQVPTRAPSRGRRVGFGLGAAALVLVGVVGGAAALRQGRGPATAHASAEVASGTSTVGAVAELASTQAGAFVERPTPSPSPTVVVVAPSSSASTSASASAPTAASSAPHAALTGPRPTAATLPGASAHPTASAPTPHDFGF